MNPMHVAWALATDEQRAKAMKLSEPKTEKSENQGKPKEKTESTKKKG